MNATDPDTLERRTVTVPDLTPGEALELSRRRARLTQTQLADSMGVSPDRVRRWERDGCRLGVPVPKVGPLSIYEVCWLVRRRRGVTLRELSAETRLSVTWLHRAEHGEIPADRAGALPAYWRSKGAIAGGRA